MNFKGSQRGKAQWALRAIRKEQVLITISNKQEMLLLNLVFPSVLFKNSLILPLWYFFTEVILF